MALTTGAMIAIAAVSAAGAISQGQNQAAQSRYQQALANQRAGRERELADLAADETRREGSRLAGEQRARLAASGVDPSKGTALLLQTDLAAETEYQALLARAEGRTQAAMTEAEGKLYGSQAKAQLRAGYINAGSRLLSSYTALRSPSPGASPNYSYGPGGTYPAPG